MKHNYVKDENWLAFHPNEDWDEWLAWRLKVDRGETRMKTLIIVRGEVGYESPITGKPITSMAQRREDMARAGCQEYDPMMRQDYERRIAAEDAEMEKSVTESIERQIEKMPSRKRDSLAIELEHGADVSVERLTVTE